MNKIRIISKVIEWAGKLLTMACMVSIGLVISNLLGFTNYSYVLVCIPIIIFLSMPVLSWLVGFFVLLYRNIKDYIVYRWIARNLKKARDEQKEIEKDLENLNRKA